MPPFLLARGTHGPSTHTVTPKGPEANVPGSLFTGKGGGTGLRTRAEDWV